MPLPQEIVDRDSSSQPKIQDSYRNTSAVLQEIDKLIWQKDRVLLNDLVFRLEQSKAPNWELGEECFVLYKPKDLIDQYERFFSTHPEFNPHRIVELGMWEGGSVAFWFEIFKPKSISRSTCDPAQTVRIFKNMLKSGDWRTDSRHIGRQTKRTRRG